MNLHYKSLFFTFLIRKCKVQKATNLKRKLDLSYNAEGMTEKGLLFSFSLSHYRAALNTCERVEFRIHPHIHT